MKKEYIRGIFLEQDNNLSQEAASGFVSDGLKSVYKLLQTHFVLFKPPFRTSILFWTCISVVILFVCISLRILSIDIIIYSIVFIAIIEYLSLNLIELQVLTSKIRRHILPSSAERVQDFLSKLPSQSLTSILGFIENNSISSTEMIKLVKESGYSGNPDLYNKLASFQVISCEFVDFLVQEKIFDSLPGLTAARLVGSCRTSITKSSYEKILAAPSSPQVIGAIIVNNPDFFPLDTHRYYFWVTMLRIDNSVNKALSELYQNTLVKIVCLILVFVLSLFGFSAIMTFLSISVYQQSQVVISSAFSIFVFDSIGYILMLILIRELRYAHYYLLGVIFKKNLRKQ